MDALWAKASTPGEQVRCHADHLSCKLLQTQNVQVIYGLCDASCIAGAHAGAALQQQVMRRIACVIYAITSIAARYTLMNVLVLVNIHMHVDPFRHLLGRIQQHQAASLLQALSQQGTGADGTAYALQLLARFAQQLHPPSFTGADRQPAWHA